jgi:indole-3-glycerol phosphate synthase
MQEKIETSFISTLVRSAKANIARGYYDREPAAVAGMERRSLKASILSSGLMPIIAEIKFSSPSEGKLREQGDVNSIARAYERAGVAGISVLTEPRHFDGDIRYLPIVKRSVGVPVLMKDIVIDPVQIDAGAAMGADAILFIAAVFMNGLATVSLEEMFATARRRHLEVLFEAHTEKELTFALGSGAELVGINNRDLGSLRVSLETSRRLLRRSREERARLRAAGNDKVVISESGLKARSEMEELRSLGADGFLIGSAIMKSPHTEATVRSLTGAKD